MKLSPSCPCRLFPMFPGWAPGPNWSMTRLLRLKWPLIRRKWPLVRLSRQNDLWSEFRDQDNLWSDGTQTMFQTIVRLWSDWDPAHCPDYVQTIVRPFRAKWPSIFLTLNVVKKPLWYARFQVHKNNNFKIFVVLLTHLWGRNFILKLVFLLFSQFGPIDIFIVEI